MEMDHHRPPACPRSSDERDIAHQRRELLRDGDIDGCRVATEAVPRDAREVTYGKRHVPESPATAIAQRIAGVGRVDTAVADASHVELGQHRLHRDLHPGRRWRLRTHDEESRLRARTPAAN